MLRGAGDSLTSSMNVLETIRDTHAVSLFIGNPGTGRLTPIDQLSIRDTYAPLVAVAGPRRTYGC
jgi:hypothetical protein